jgi:hypothetical protein
VRTIQFSVSEEEYLQVATFAAMIGLAGHYAVSNLGRILVLQGTGASVAAYTRSDRGLLRGVLTSFTRAEYLALEDYVRIKKGYAGPNPVATFIHKAAFDIMAKYPPKRSGT